MGKRALEDRSETSVNLAGDLRGALHRHTHERAKHFFYYLFTMKALVHYLNQKAKLGLAADEGVAVAATEQIDTGFRRLKSHGARYRAFDDGDAGVVSLTSSDFGSMDAAHFCNLGIKPAFVSKIGEYISAKYRATDPLPFDLYEELKKFSGNTQLLPQRVNIGPDRVIDEMHGDLAGPMLTSSTKVVSAANIATYRTTAIERMEAYRKTALGNEDLGIAACADCYLEMYQDVGVPSAEARRKVRVAYARQIRAIPSGHAFPEAPAPPRLPFAQVVYGSVGPAVQGRCMASGGALDVVDYLV
jgi:hypothetical protein